MDTVNAVVVGVGRMGNHHARNYAAIDGYKLVAVVDSHSENAARAATQYECKAFSTVEELLTWSRETHTPVHAATVAVPTVHHRAMAEVLAAAGVDLLIEKPLAPSVADGRAIVDVARKHGRV